MIIQFPTPTNDCRAAMIQEAHRRAGLPVPSERFIRGTDKEAVDRVKGTDREPRSLTVAGFVEWTERLIRESHLIITPLSITQGGEDKVDMIAQITDGGATMPKGYLDGVAAQYQAAKDAGLYDEEGRLQTEAERELRSDFAALGIAL